MATLDYHKIGKGIAFDGSTRYTFYGKDFNPNIPSLPSWSTVSASEETSNFNLTGFQPGNEVGCLVLHFTTPTSGTLYLESEFQAYLGGGYQTTWGNSRSYNVSSSGFFAYVYFGVDYDEIWDETNQYRTVVNREFSDGTGENGVMNYFTVSNLSIDSGYHSSGYLWVEGNYLCYTDGIFGDLGFKHKINYDTGYSGGSGEPGHIWVGSGTTGRIYYTDAYGNVRRTHLADSRYGGSRYGSPGYIYVSNGWDASDGYGYLCFVDGNGELRRLGNGVP